MDNGMKTIYRLLDQDTIDMAVSELESSRNTPTWGTNLNGWPLPLYSNAVIGTVTHKRVSPQLEQRVVNALLPHIPGGWKEILVQHYLWHPLSGINMHDDAGHVFGATIYLTPEWNINWGGLFLYSLTDSVDDLKVIYPTFNSVNINTNGLHHSVTTVSPLAPRPRYTLQIWGKASSQ